MDIITKILNLSKDGVKKTNILYQCNLSYTQLQSYLPFLIKKNVLEEYLVKNEEKNYKNYKTTSKGLDLLEAAQKITNLLR